ncbi:MAG: glycosyltransferase family 9 protein [Saprospiraceae bacterium]|nr:glycosyltransferase family 9 protein [Saprospiraceae bacterium]
MKVLVIQQKRVGDVLVSTIICEALRQEFPQAEIHYMVYTYTKGVAENHPAIDRLIEFTDEHKKSRSAFFKFCQDIKAQQYDVVIDAYSKTESWIISKFSRAPKRITYDKGVRKLFFTHAVKPMLDASGQEHITMRRLSLLTPLTDTPIHSMNHSPSIHIDATAQEEQRQVLQQNDVDISKPLIMIGLFGRIPQKTWPIAYMKKLVEALAQQPDMQLIFNYDRDQQSMFHHLIDGLDVPAGAVFPNVYGNSLKDLIHLISHCSAYIGNDSGPIHIAKAVGRPTFTIFSPGISKAGWFTEANKQEHSAVHLEDIRPDLFSSKPVVDDDEVLTMYDLMKPDWVIEEVMSFLARLSSRI